MKSSRMLATALVATTLSAFALTAPADARHHNNDYQNYLNAVAMQNIYNQRLSEQCATQYQQNLWYQSQAAQAAAHGFGNPYMYGGYGHNYTRYMGGGLNHFSGWHR